MLIDILLGGDNAVVIALAVRKLDPSKRRQGIVWGTIGAIALRILLIVFALSLLSVPYLKVVGALLLLWIGVKLLLPEEEDAHGNIASSDKLWVAVRTVIVADLVMSIDNVIAIAGAAQSVGGHHEIPLVIFGLLVSVPIIIWGSQMVIRLMDRFPHRHHHRRHAAGVDCRGHADHRPGRGRPRQCLATADQVHRRGGRRPAGAADRHPECPPTKEQGR